MRLLVPVVVLLGFSRDRVDVDLLLNDELLLVSGELGRVVVVFGLMLVCEVGQRVIALVLFVVDPSALFLPKRIE